MASEAGPAPYLGQCVERTPLVEVTLAGQFEQGVSSMEPSISVDEIHDLIRTRAYRIWESEGRPEGMDHQHWLAAEKEVLEEVDRSGATGPTVTAAIAHEPRRSGDADERQDDLLDEAIEETFPASDPVSPKQIT